MRKTVRWARTTAVFMAIAFAPPPARAVTIAAPAGLAKAAQTANLTQVAYVCRWGWYWRYQGCWWTSDYAYYYRPYYAYAYYPSYSYYRPAFAAYYPYGHYRSYRAWWGWR